MSPPPPRAQAGLTDCHNSKAPEEAFPGSECWGPDKVGEEQTKRDPPQENTRPEDRCRVLPIKRLKGTGQGHLRKRFQATAGRMLYVRVALSSLLENSEPGSGDFRATQACHLTYSTSSLCRAPGWELCQGPTCHPSGHSPAIGHQACVSSIERPTQHARGGERDPTPSCLCPRSHPSILLGPLAFSMIFFFSFPFSPSRNGYALAQVMDTDIYVNPKTYNRVSNPKLRPISFALPPPQRKEGLKKKKKANKDMPAT